MSQPCLPVNRRRKRQDLEEPSADDFDDIQNIDATEYLSRVIRQAKSLPEVFIAPDEGHGTGSSLGNHSNLAPIDGSAASLFHLVSGRASLIPAASADHLPRNDIWIEKTISNFEKLRDYLQKCKEYGIGGKKTERIALPPMKDRPGWHRFCVGNDEARGNEGSYFDDDDEGACDECVDESADWLAGIPPTGYTPSVRLLCQMDQVLIRIVLSHLCYYISQGWSPVSAQRTAWMYALLARLEKPVHRDDAAIQYSLLKTLTKARAESDVHDRTSLARLNVLIVLIGIYFEQGGKCVMEQK